MRRGSARKSAATGRERRAVVSADHARQPVLPEQPLEDGPGAHGPRRAEPRGIRAGPRVEVGDRERVAVLAVDEALPARPRMPAPIPSQLSNER
jgi:hypothetical protein